MRVAAAQLWELWRSDLVALSLRMTYACCFVAMLVALSSALDDAQRWVLQGVVVMILIPAGVGSSLWASELDQQPRGFALRLGFTRPISTWQLVAVPFVYLAVTNLAVFLLPAMVFRTLAGGEIPLFGPGLIVFCAGNLMVAAAWCPAGRVAKYLGLIGVLVGLAAVGFLSTRGDDSEQPWLMRIGQASAWQIPWWGVLLAIVPVVIALWMTIFAVGRKRCSEPLVCSPFSGWSFASLWQTDSRWRWVDRYSFGDRAAIPGAESATLMFELRRALPPVLILGTIVPLLALAFLIVGQFLFGPPRYAPGCWLLLLGISPIVYQVVAINGVAGLETTDGNTTMSAFEATRPLTCGQLVLFKLVAVATSCLVGWSLIWLAALVHASTPGQSAHWWGLVGAAGQVAPTAFPWLIFSALCSVILLFVVSSCLLLVGGLMMTEKPQWLIGGAVLMAAHICAWFWDRRHGDALSGYWDVLCYVMAMLIAVVSGRIIWQSWESGFAGSRMLLAFTLLWCVHVAVTVDVVRQLPEEWTTQIPVQVWVLTAAMLLIPLATYASAPMAIAYHRHR